MLPNLTVIVVYGLYIINNNKVSVYSLSSKVFFIICTWLERAEISFIDSC